MWRNILERLKKNLFWLILLIIFLVPQIREPIQILLNKGFSFVNVVTKEEELISADLEDLVLLDSLNNRVDVSNFKNEVVFINFWATWCPPCIAEMPSIENLFQDYGDRVKFVLISNEKTDITNAFFAKKGYSFESFRPQSVPDVLHTTSIPRTLIIDKTGTIIVDKSGSVNWNSEHIRSILNELLNSSI